MTDRFNGLTQFQRIKLLRQNADLTGVIPDGNRLTGLLAPNNSLDTNHRVWVQPGKFQGGGSWNGKPRIGFQRTGNIYAVETGGPQGDVQDLAKSVQGPGIDPFDTDKFSQQFLTSSIRAVSPDERS